MNQKTFIKATIDALQSINEDKRYEAEEGDSAQEAKVDKAVAHIEKHAKAGKYKVNYKDNHGDHHNVATGKDTKAHSKPDITIHGDHNIEGHYGYTVHKGGAAENDTALHHKDLQ